MARGKSLASFSRAFVNRGSRLFQAGPRLRQRPLERPQVGFVALDPLELRFGRRQPIGQVVGCAMESRCQPPVDGHPRLELLEPRGVFAPALGEPAQAEGDFARLVGEPLERADGLAELGRGL